MDAYIDETNQVRLHVFDPACFYPMVDGGYVTVIPFVSVDAESSRYDKAEVCIASPDGMVENRIYDWEAGSLGRLEDIYEPTMVSMPVIIPRAPLIDGWGISAFADIAPLVLEQAVRLSSYSHILNAHESPTLIYTTSTKDVDILSVESQEFRPEKAKAEAMTSAYRCLLYTSPSPRD